MNKLFAMLSAAVMITVAPVSAKTDKAHTRLINTLESVGVDVMYNTKAHCMSRAMGMYSSTDNLLVICQQRSDEVNEKEVSWTAEDLDTLRHEAHHVLQDCVGGGELFDGYLDNYMDDMDAKRFIVNILSQKQIASIIKTYANADVPERNIKFELEAFAVARSMSADMISDNIEHVKLGKLH